MLVSGLVDFINFYISYPVFPHVHLHCVYLFCSISSFSNKALQIAVPETIAVFSAPAPVESILQTVGTDRAKIILASNYPGTAGGFRFFLFFSCTQSPPTAVDQDIDAAPFTFFQTTFVPPKYEHNCTLPLMSIKFVFLLLESRHN